jgi:hypothetical protein
MSLEWMKRPAPTLRTEIAALIWHNRHKMARTLLIIASLVAPALAQSAAVPAFEVASVKLVAEPRLPAFMSDMARYNGGPGTKTPGKFECKEVTLKSLLARAYNLPPTRISGPTGSTPHGTTSPPGSTRKPRPTTSV